MTITQTIKREIRLFSFNQKSEMKKYFLLSNSNENLINQIGHQKVIAIFNESDRKFQILVENISTDTFDENDLAVQKLRTEFKCIKVAIFSRNRRNGLSTFLHCNLQFRSAI